MELIVALWFQASSCYRLCPRHCCPRRSKRKRRQQYRSPPGTTARRNRQSSTSCAPPPIRQARNSCRPKSASPVSIRTAHCGSSTRSTLRFVYCLDRVPAVVAQKPELKNREPFKTILSGNREAMAKLSLHDLEEILVATLTGMPVEVFRGRGQRNGLRPPSIRAGSALTPISPISRCRKSCSTCATTASRPIS